MVDKDGLGLPAEPIEKLGQEDKASGSPQKSWRSTCAAWDCSQENTCHKLKQRSARQSQIAHCYAQGNRQTMGGSIPWPSSVREQEGLLRPVMSSRRLGDRRRGRRRAKHVDSDWTTTNFAITQK